MDGAFFDEGALIHIHQLIQLRRQPSRHYFGCKFGETINETDGSIVACSLRDFLLGQKRDEGVVEPLETSSIQIVEGMHGPDYIALYYLPSGNVELLRESVRSRRLVVWHGFDRFPDFILRKMADPGAQAPSSALQLLGGRSRLSAGHQFP